MKTSTTAISATVLSGFLVSFAMIPLPTFEGSPTGLKLLYRTLSLPHIVEMEDWVAGLHTLNHNENKKLNAIKDAQFHRYLHRAAKASIYHIPDPIEKEKAFDDWKEENQKLNQELERLKDQRDGIQSARSVMIAETPTIRLRQQ